MEELKTLKQLRKVRRLTQKELSELSGVSIRTIQRIEKGLTQGSPHTIKTLAKSLEVESADILISDQESGIEQDEFQKVKLINFSILIVLLIPFGNLVLPTVLFFIHRSDKHVNSLGRKIISAQILITFILFVLSVIIFLIIGRGNGAVPKPVFVIYLMYSIVFILVVIRTSKNIDAEKPILKHFPNFI